MQIGTWTQRPTRAQFWGLSHGNNKPFPHGVATNGGWHESWNTDSDRGNSGSILLSSKAVREPLKPSTRRAPILGLPRPAWGPISLRPDSICLLPCAKPPRPTPRSRGQPAHGPLTAILGREEDKKRGTTEERIQRRGDRTGQTPRRRRCAWQR